MPFAHSSPIHWRGRGARPPTTRCVLCVLFSHNDSTLRSCQHNLRFSKMSLAKISVQLIGGFSLVIGGAVLVSTSMVYNIERKATRFPQTGKGGTSEYRSARLAVHDAAQPACKRYRALGTRGRQCIDRRCGPVQTVRTHAVEVQHRSRRRRTAGRRQPLCRLSGASTAGATIQKSAIEAAGISFYGLKSRCRTPSLLGRLLHGSACSSKRNRAPDLLSDRCCG